MYTIEAPETTRNLTLRHFPLKVFFEFVGPIIDSETGELLEYYWVKKKQSTEMNAAYILDIKYDACTKE